MIARAGKPLGTPPRARERRLQLLQTTCFASWLLRLRDAYQQQRVRRPPALAVSDGRLWFDARHFTP